MSNIDKRALREATEKALSAGDGNWQTWREAGMNYPEIFTSSGHIVATVNGSFSVIRSDFIAAANPATVLALLDELEAKDKLNAELMEKQRLIDICQGQGLEHRIAADKRAEAAESRIAELSQKAEIYDMLRHDYELQGSLVDFVDWQEKRIAELSHHLQSAHAFIEHTEVFGYEASNGILCCGDAQWNIDASKSALAAAAKGE
ncbi:ead/Ea22-like family protein [Enterobacter hormaechei]|uniref:ead/Ea22-like family protein n=1 Tax=Enterobacter hormaechei TaxID=158836 RepID=UPI0015FE0814|nr:ead/Ea22-like family protein [Enterobacter hormaechei]MBA7865572.1 ead/Ea22-like family protein [Enterobacter hormaechei]